MRYLCFTPEFGTPHCLFCPCAVILMILRVAFWSASLLLGLVSFWVLRWFHGLLKNILVLPCLPQRPSMLLPLTIVRSYFG
jgi:hypothetical protein